MSEQSEPDPIGALELRCAKLEHELCQKQAAILELLERNNKNYEIFLKAFHLRLDKLESCTKKPQIYTGD